MRDLGHRLIGIGFWIVLIACWVILVLQGKVSSAGLRDTALELAVLAGAVLAVTLWWVRHNVAIYRKKGARKATPMHRPATDQDRLGRSVRWALPGEFVGALNVEHLVVEVGDDDVKVYRSEGAPA